MISARVAVVSFTTGIILFSGPSSSQNESGTPPGAFTEPVLASAICGSGNTDPRPRLAFYAKLAKNELGPVQTPYERAPQGAYEMAEPPLFNNLGNLTFPITTTNPRAQAYFDQGLRLAYAFNHAEARRAFRMAQRIDPGCAMCWWGEAFALGPNINAPMDEAARQPAFEAARQAKIRATRVSPLEKDLIRAVAQRYGAPDAKDDRQQRDAEYARVMTSVARRHHRNDHVQVLHADALMNLQPWDYWEQGGRKAKGRTPEIITALERVLARNPNHAGAIHLYIHMTEASSNPARAEPYARRLGGAMPGAGHLVHMPFHTFYRMGLYKDALAANVAAVEADETYIRQVGPEGIYPAAYYPHNIHSLMVSAQMAGDGDSAVKAAEKLSQVIEQGADRTIPWVQPILVAPYFVHAQFSAPEVTLMLADPGPSLPYVKAMWHYARGVALARQGNAQAAQKEAQALSELQKNSDFSALEEGGVPASDVLKLAQHVVKGRIAQSQKRYSVAVNEFKQAVAIEDRLAYSEPPFWYYPVRQSLGATLLQMGKPREAERVFRASLAKAPNNGWALWGMSQAYAKQGQADAARVFAERYQNAWAGSEAPKDLMAL